MMANEQDKNPTTGQESDISKSQATQQPTDQSRSQSGADQQGRQADTGRTGDQAATGHGQSGNSPAEGLQGDTATQQRSDVEGSSLSKEKGEAESGFVGSQGQQDSSSELVDKEDDDFAKGGQGAPEGK
jgi:hypothetical protein